ncbi:molybdopterin cofactor-binding domain-containing protein [Rhizorhabdus histidinilytica]
MFAVVAEVKVERGLVKVERIVVAVDCGIPINPDNIRAQFEGGTGFMLSAVLRNRITLKDGEIEQRNFDAYEPTRIHEMPEVEVHVMQSTAAPGGR